MVAWSVEVVRDLIETAGGWKGWRKERDTLSV
jgi:hypothetical protein